MSTVTEASYQEHGAINATIDGVAWSGITDQSRFYQDVMDWVAEGNTIDPYVPPPDPTNYEIFMQRMDSDPIFKAVLIALVKGTLVPGSNINGQQVAQIVSREM